MPRISVSHLGGMGANDANASSSQDKKEFLAERSKKKDLAMEKERKDPGKRVAYFGNLIFFSITISRNISFVATRGTGFD